MKRLLSLLLVIAMLFSICTVFTACDSTSVSDKDDDDDKKKEEDEVEPTLVFKGLKIVLPEDFEVDDQNAEYGYVDFANDTYGITVMANPLEDEMEGMDAKELRDYYMDMLDPGDEDNEVGEYDTGKKNGTQYLYAIKADETTALVIAFYVDDDYGWMVQIRPLEEDAEGEFDIDEMIALVTGWKCKKPDPNEEEENEGDEGGIAVPQPPVNETIPGMEEVEGQVIYNNMGVIVKWTGTEVNSRVYYIDLFISNNTEFDIELSGSDFVLNSNAAFPTYLYACVASGETHTSSIALYREDMDRYGAAVIGSLEFTISVTDASSYQILDDGTHVQIFTEDYGYVNDVFSGGDVLFDEKQLRVVLQDIHIGDAYDSVMWLYVENNGNQAISLGLTEFYIMGWYLPEIYAYSSLMPGTYTYIGLDISSLLELGIVTASDIENLSCNLLCSYRTEDGYSGDDFDSEIFYCPGDPYAVQNVYIRGENLFYGNGLDITLVDVVADEYAIALKVYLGNSSGMDMFIELSNAQLNGYDSFAGVYMNLPANTQCLHTIWLWYSEDYDFEDLDDLKSYTMELLARDYYYDIIADEEIIFIGK